MKKTLKEIFDGATAEETDVLVKRNPVPAPSPDALASVKSSVAVSAGYDAPDAKKKKAGILWKSAAAAAACLLIAFGVFAVLRALRGEVPSSPLPADPDDIVWGRADMQEAPAEVPAPDWNGWHTGPLLLAELEKADAETVFALHVSKVFSDGYVYDGKTVAQFRIEKEEKNAVAEKLMLLLKTGDILKYGEAVYTVGTPEGEKWSRELYEETRASIGAEFLSEYLSDVAFDRERAQKDLAAAEDEVRRLEGVLDEAYGEFRQAAAGDAAKAFSDAGIPVVEKNGKTFVFITKKHLTELELPEKDFYLLTLALRRNYEHVAGDVPVFDSASVSGFALEKIDCEIPDGSSRNARSDAELIDMINDLIRAREFDTDVVTVRITSSDELPREAFDGMEYESVTLTKKYKTSAFVWLYVRSDKLNLEALKEISNISPVKTVSIGMDQSVPDSE